MSTGLPELPYPCLLADIGGTNARFALLRSGKIEALRVMDGASFSSLDAAARAYLEDEQCEPAAASIAIAAPITGDEVRMTNHTWKFSIAALRAELNLDRLIVLNDFTALAMSLRHLPTADLKQLGGGKADPASAIALIGPGTGLGVSGLIPHPSGWTPLQGEGGHVTLPASTAREGAIIEAMARRFGHVSAERAISGPGLVHVYTAICDIDGVDAERVEPSDVTNRALSNADARCAETLRLFCGWLGSVAGNLALTLGAAGGVYLGGGIVPRLGDYFMQSEFRARFESKGRYREYLAPIPVFTIHSSRAAFYGLARSLADAGPRIEVRR